MTLSGQERERSSSTASLEPLVVVSDLYSDGTEQNVPDNEAPQTVSLEAASGSEGRNESVTSPGGRKTSGFIGPEPPPLSLRMTEGCTVVLSTLFHSTSFADLCVCCRIQFDC